MPEDRRCVAGGGPPRKWWEQAVGLLPCASRFESCSKRCKGRTPSGRMKLVKAGMRGMTNWGARTPSNWSLVTRHSSLITRRWSLITRHSSLRQPAGSAVPTPVDGAGRGRRTARALGVPTGTTPPRVGRPRLGDGLDRSLTPPATDCRWAWGILCVLGATMRADARTQPLRNPRPWDWNRLCPVGSKKPPVHHACTRGQWLSIGYWLLLP